MIRKLPETADERTIRQRALVLLAGVSCAVRLIYSDAVHLQNTGNAGWIQTIGGTLLAMPALILLLNLLSAKSAQDMAQTRLQKAVCALFIPCFTFDCSSWVYSLAESSTYTAFAEDGLLLLYLPALLTTMLIASRGANACGGFAKGALIIVVFFIGLAMFLQIDQMHPVWLTPLFGGGIERLLRGSVLCGGYAVLYPAGLWTLLGTGSGSLEGSVRRRIVRALPLSGLMATIFLLLYGMLSPNIPYAPHIRSFALERLLTGGGRSTSVHFPSLVAWYVMLLTSAVYSMFCASVALSRLFPKRSMLYCSVISALLSLIWTPVRMFWKHGEDFLVFANIVIVTIALLMLYLQKKRLERREQLA